jgi:hypothetical protein
MTEAQFHRTVADYLDWCLLPPAWYTTFPAGWFKGKVTGGILRGAGLKAGMPDILIWYNGFTIGMELKTPRGRLSEAQRSTRKRLEQAGVKYIVCRDLQDVVNNLEMLQIPLRRSRLAA